MDETAQRYTVCASGLFFSRCCRRVRSFTFFVVLILQAEPEAVSAGRVGRRTQSAAHAADYYIRQQTGRLVALRKRPHLAGGALHKNRRRTLSLLHGAKGAARPQRSGVGPPGAGAAVGLREKRAARPGGYQRRKREIRLVAVRKGAQLAGAHPVPHGGLRLPGLCRKTAPARRKRPRVGLSGACKAVGRCAKRKSAPAGRAAWDGEKSLVDMRTRPPLARSNLDAHTQPERLPGLRREAGPAGLQ